MLRRHYPPTKGECRKVMGILESSEDTEALGRVRERVPKSALCELPGGVCSTKRTSCECSSELTCCGNTPFNTLVKMSEHKRIIYMYIYMRKI